MNNSPKGKLLNFMFGYCTKPAVLFVPLFEILTSRVVKLNLIMLVVVVILISCN